MPHYPKLIKQPTQGVTISTNGVKIGSLSIWGAGKAGSKWLGPELLTWVGEANPGPIWYLGLALLCSLWRVGRSDADSDSIADSHKPTLSTFADHFYPFSLPPNWTWNNFYCSQSITYSTASWSELCVSDEKSALGLKFGRSAGRKRSIPVIHPPLPAPDSSDPSHPVTAFQHNPPADS